jgi:hypothetical protein
MGSFDLRSARDTIVVAYPRLSQWDGFLLMSLNISREASIEGSTLNAVVLNTLVQGKAEGWLPQLMYEMAKDRPMNRAVQELFLQYAADMVSEAKRKDLQARVAEAYASFGLAPPLVVQQAGTVTEEIKPTDAGLQRTLREDLGFLNVAQWREKLYRLEGRVCRVELNDARGSMGTAFLVGPSAVMTNYHVLGAVVEGTHPAAQVRCRFDYKVLPGGRVADGMPVGLAGDGILGSAPPSPGERAGTPDTPPPEPGQLDYVLARLERPIGDEPVGSDGPARGWVEVPGAQPALAGMAALVILQHPLRQPLKLALDTLPKVELRHGGLRVRYATNTEAGSSGSPCFDKDWKLVALHHYGDPASHTPTFNQGIPIGLIRESLSAAARAQLGGPCD